MTSMKKMLQYLLTGAVTLLSFSSCYVYQMNTVSSTNLVHDPAKGNFVYENDSVRVTYTLGALQSPPLTIEIFNKLNEPLLIDWQRSALVYNDSSINYATSKANFVASSDGISVNVARDVSLTGGTTHGQVTLPKHQEFIPPHSFIRNTPVNLPGNLLRTIPDTALHPLLLSLRDNTQTSKARKAVFTADNSPLNFTSFLTFYNSNKEHPVAIPYQHRFYISELVQTKTVPSNTFYLDEAPGSRYFLKGAVSGDSQAGPAARTAVAGAR